MKESTTARFRKLSPMYENAVVNADATHLAVAYDVMTDRMDKHGKAVVGKRYLGFSTFAGLLEWYSTHNPRCVYEIQRETLPMAVAFDVELKFSDSRHMAVCSAMKLSTDPEVLLQQIVSSIVAALPQLSGTPPLVAASHDAGRKISYHIKFSHVMLPTMHHRDQFRHILSIKLANLIPVIDPSVYYKNKNMRMLWSYKLTDLDRLLLPHRVEASSPVDLEAVKQHMWCYVPPGAVPFDTAPYACELEKFCPSAAVSVSRHHTGSPGSSCSRKRGREATDGADDSWVEAVRRVMRLWKPPSRTCSLSNSIDLPVTIKNRSLHGPGGELYFHTSGERTCPYGRSHTSNNFVVNVSNEGWACLHCFGVECQREKSVYLGSLYCSSFIPVGEASTRVYAAAVASKFSLAPHVLDICGVWRNDNTECVFEPEKAQRCIHCRCSAVSKFYVTMSGGQVKARHDAGRGVLCEFTLSLETMNLHDAFCEARDADSRTLAPEERAHVARLLGQPTFANADAGWSCTLKMRVTLRRKTSNGACQYLVVADFKDGTFSWITTAPWMWRDRRAERRVSAQVVQSLFSEPSR
jgi:hypothetical protein